MFPMLSTFSFAGIGNIVSENNLQVEQQNKQVEVMNAKAKLIDEYFARNDAPLEGYGKVFVEVAEKYDLDYRVLPAMAQRESSGFKDGCDSVPNNPFGWTSCKYGFDSIEQAIETVGKNIAGENERTARYYANKTLRERLIAYNGVGVVPAYPDEVMTIMKKIGSQNPSLR